MNLASVMSPPAVELAEAQWLAQFAAMRAALADLKLPLQRVISQQEKPYEEDFDFDEEFSSTNSGDDVWDFISDEDIEEYSGDLVDGVEITTEISDVRYGPEWLRNKCALLANSKQWLSPEDLQEQVTALLASDSGEEELQSSLTDIIGFDDLDFVIELISHRKELTSSPPPRSGPADGVLGRLQTRRQREEALRRQDYEHKHAVLGPSLDRDGPQYPHVYKAHTAGNTLSVGGRKYALPQGSERKDHEVRFGNLHIQAWLTVSRNMKSIPFQLAV
jgi:antiviral helicase SLH1